MICPICGKEFLKVSNQKYCFNCKENSHRLKHNEACKNWYLKNKEKSIKTSKKWAINNKEFVLKYNKEYQKGWREKNIDRKHELANNWAYENKVKMNGKLYYKTQLTGGLKLLAENIIESKKIKNYLQEIQNET